MEVSDLPVMKSCCKTCPFKEVDGRQQDPELAAAVVERTLFKAQKVCHGTEGENRKARNRCKGSHDYNVTLYKRLGMEPEKHMNNYIEVS